MDKYDTIIQLLTEQNEILRGLVEAKQMPKGNGMYTLWDLEQEEFLIEKYLTEELTLENIIPLIKERFGIDRTTGALLARLRKLGIKMRAEEPSALPVTERNYDKAVF